MLSGIGIDICLVLYLQLTRRAVQKALGFDLELLQQIHIGCSTLALLLYFPTLYLGVQLLRTKAPSVLCADSAILDMQSEASRRMSLRRWHIRFAQSAFIARTLGLLFMFSMWKNP